MHQAVKRSEATRLTDRLTERTSLRSPLPGLPLVLCSLCLLFAHSALPAQDAPEIQVIPEEALSFGARDLNARYSGRLIVRNIGTAPLDVTEITLFPSRGVFSIISGAQPIAIAPDAQVTIEILYVPTAVRQDTARIEIRSNDADEPLVTVRLSGFGTLEPKSDIRVLPASVDFGDVLVGTPNAMNVRVTNSGVAQLEIRSLQLVTSGSDFSLDGFAPPLSLPFGASVQAKITYTPSEEGADLGLLMIESNDADEPVVEVPLSGNGVLEPVPQIQVMPTEVDFMEVFVGTASSISIEIMNTGTAPLDLMSPDLGPGSSGDFSITGSADPVSVAPGASVTTEVTYSPPEEGADSGTLRIGSNDPTRPVLTVSLVGIGVPVPAPQIQVTPDSLDFGNVFLDSSRAMSVEIMNTGTASLEITSIALGIDTSTDFAVTGFAQSISLAPGAKVTTEVTYTPTDLGIDSGTVVIDSNDAGQPRVAVSLSGAGVPAPIPRIQLTAPLVLNYGMVFIGSSSTMSVGIGNVGTAPLEVSGIELGPDSSADFEITGFSESISLVPGGSVTTEITYTPADEGIDSGTLVIRSNDSDEPVVTVSLAGSGVPVPVARIQVTPTSLEFNEVFVDSPISLTVEIANIGTALLDVSSIHLGPETSGDFAITGFDQRIVLVPGGSVLTRITYTPSGEGADSGTLVIESDDAERGASVVSLSGVGVAEPMPRIQVTPTALDYERVQIGAESTLSVTIGNSGMERLDVSFVGLGADTRGEFVITGGPESASIPPGGEVTVDVTYSPSDEGSDSGTLRIESNDREHPVLNVALSGTGVFAPVPQIRVVPAALTFGDVSIGSSSRLTLSISNTGSALLRVLDVSLGTATSPDFEITGGESSAELDSGEETTIEVTYTPSDPASDSGTLRIQSNATENPLVTVSLFGTGVLTSEPRFVRADSNTDGKVDVGDPVTTIGFLFRDESVPSCFDAADANDDGSLNLSDAIFTLNWLFNGGPSAPPPGSRSCGPDPTEDGLSLCVYPLDLCE